MPNRMLLDWLRCHVQIWWEATFIIVFFKQCLLYCVTCLWTSWHCLRTASDKLWYWQDKRAYMIWFSSDSPGLVPLKKVTRHKMSCHPSGCIYWWQCQQLVGMVYGGGGYGVIPSAYHAFCNQQCTIILFVYRGGFRHQIYRWIISWNTSVQI